MATLAGKVAMVTGAGGEHGFGRATPHATAAEAHNRLMLTKALDLSARRKCSVSLPITPEDEER